MPWFSWFVVLAVVALLIVGAVKQWKLRLRWRRVWFDLGWYYGEPLVLFQVVVCEWTGDFFTFFMVHVARYTVMLGMEGGEGGTLVEDDAE